MLRPIPAATTRQVFPSDSRARLYISAPDALRDAIDAEHPFYGQRGQGLCRHEMALVFGRPSPVREWHKERARRNAAEFARRSRLSPVAAAMSEVTRTARGEKPLSMEAMEYDGQGEYANA